MTGVVMIRSSGTASSLARRTMNSTVVPLPYLTLNLVSLAVRGRSALDDLPQQIYSYKAVGTLAYLEEFRTKGRFILGCWAQHF